MKKTGGKSYDMKSGNNILDVARLEGAVKGVDGIFHCAALISVPDSVAQPDLYFENNVTGTENVIKAAEAAKVSKIVFSSSAATYGEYDVKVTEDVMLDPASPYGQNKVDGEVALMHSSVPSVALRYFNVYGPGQSREYAGAVITFIRKALAGEDIVIYGDGGAIRDFIYIDDIVSANIAAMSYVGDSFIKFNIGTEIETTVKKLAETIIKITKSPSKIKYETPRPGDVLYSGADCSKARKLLKWEAKVSLEDGLRKTIEFYR